jgi:glycine/D-amino acid oxidase-like deaminating enzyme
MSHRTTADKNVENRSIWTATAKRDPMPPLGQSAETDVCVVGAGIAGLTAAYLLVREGKSVIVLDKGALDSGETPRTSAHLSNVLDSRYKTIARMHGDDGARKAAESHTAAICEIESIAEHEHIDCEFRRVDGYLFLARGDSKSSLEEEFAALRDAGLAVEWSGPPSNGTNLGQCLRFPDQAQFHPVKYLAGLDAAFKRLGGKIYSQTEVTQIDSGPTTRVATNRGFHISARDVIVATNNPVNDRVKMHTKQAAYRSYIVGMSLPDGEVPAALYWDTDDPFHYVRTERIRNGQKAETILIVGGEDHKTGQEGRDHDQYARLAGWAKEYFPSVGDVRFRWSGQIINSMDSLAFIGRNPGDTDHVFIVCGDTGNGLTHGTIAGILLRDLILGRYNPWAELYDPARKNVRAIGTFARENLNVATEYSEWVRPGEADDESKIKPGTGAVIRKGLTKRRGVSRFVRPTSRVLRSLSSSWLYRCLERAGTKLGLPLPRLSLFSGGEGSQWSRCQRSDASCS